MLTEYIEDRLIRIFGSTWYFISEKEESLPTFLSSSHYSIRNSTIKKHPTCQTFKLPVVVGQRTTWEAITFAFVSHISPPLILPSWVLTMSIRFQNESISKRILSTSPSCFATRWRLGQIVHRPNVFRSVWVIPADRLQPKSKILSWARPKFHPHFVRPPWPILQLGARSSTGYSTHPSINR